MITLILTKEELQLVKDGLWALIVADGTDIGQVRPVHRLWEKLASLPPSPAK